MTSQITIWEWYLHYIMTFDDKWTAIMQSFNHNMLVEVTLLRFTSAVGKWALDSSAGTTLFNVTTAARIFGIICYVVPSMFMTADPSSSKLYVKFEVSFMTHEAHGMSGNVISIFPGAKVHIVFRPKTKKLSPKHVCRAEFLHPLWESDTSVSMLLCLMVSAWLQAGICMQSCLSPFHSRGPSGVTEWRFLEVPRTLLPKSDWAGVSLILPVQNTATKRSEKKREFLSGFRTWNNISPHFLIHRQ